jgi:hypothetical protein
MHAIDMGTAAIQRRAHGKFTRLRILLSFSLLDGLSAWLMILLYITGIDLVWLVNLNFAVMSAVLILFSFHMSRVKHLTLLFGVTLLISLVKLALYMDDSRGFQWTHFVTYFQGLIMPIAALSFASQFSAEESNEVLKILTRYARAFLWLALPGILTYSALYFLGYISYFGLGANLFYIYPFLAAKGNFLYAAIFFAIALFTGKRASFITVLSQFFLLNYTSFRRSKIWTVLLGGALLTVTLWIYENTDLLFRFKWIFESEFDFADPYFLSISGGGRFEEVFGIYEYFIKYPFDLPLGAPPGSYYIWTLEWSDYAATKNYSHITWIGYVFRYGLFFTVPLIAYFAYLIFRNLGATNPLFIAFGGIFAASFFGGLLVVDPTSWILIGLFVYSCGKPLGSSARTTTPRYTLHSNVKNP